MTRRLLFSYLTVTAFVLVLLEIPLGIVFQQREIDRLSADLEHDASVLASIYEDALETQVPLDPVPADDYTLTTGSRVVVVDPAGISLIDTEAAVDRDFSTRPEFSVALAGSRSVGIRRSDTLDTDLMFVAVPVASGGTVHGALRLTLDTQEVDEQVLRFWLALAAVALVVLVVVAGVGWAVARWLTRPIRRLQGTATRFSRGDLSQSKPDRRSPPELVELETTLNTMASRLDTLLGQQRDFVADASHQLRTPLTGLRLLLENLQQGAVAVSDSAQIDRALEEADRLAALVNDLLILARAEKQPTVGRTDLAQLARDRVDTWTVVADQADVSIRLDSPFSAEVYAASGAIEQILDNLLDNAVAVVPGGSEIVVGVRPGPERTSLVVTDHGPGLDESHKSRALDRFWRGDTTRPGTGLGLSIVAALARSSQGTVELSDATPSGLTVTVSLLTAKPGRPARPPGE